MLKNLKNSIFRQPEGICFSPDGEILFISNEGKNKKGNILVFNKVDKNKAKDDEHK
jgi:sugar lactone lactonase YvrE